MDAPHAYQLLKEVTGTVAAITGIVLAAVAFGIGVVTAALAMLS